MSGWLEKQRFNEIPNPLRSCFKVTRPSAAGSFTKSCAWSWASHWPAFLILASSIQSLRTRCCCRHEVARCLVARCCNSILKCEREFCTFFALFELQCKNCWDRRQGREEELRSLHCRFKDPILGMLHQCRAPHLVILHCYIRKCNSTLLFNCTMLLFILPVFWHVLVPVLLHLDRGILYFW